MQKNKIRKRPKLYLGLVIIIIIIFSLASIIPSENLRFGNGQIYSLNENVRVRHLEKGFENITLPFKVNASKGDEVFVDVKIPDFFPNKFSINIRSSMQDIAVFIEGEEVFSTAKPKPYALDIPEVSAWHIVDLPSNIQGKTLTLKIFSDVEAFSGTINTIFAGDGDDLLYKVIYDEKMGIIIASFIFMFGIFSLIISVSLRNLNDNRMLYLGLFSIIVSIWIFSETRTLQFITGNRFIIGGISYMMLSLMLIPIILYLKDAVLIENEKTLNYIVYFLFTVFLTNILLQILDISNFIESIAYIFIINLIISLYLIRLLVSEVIKLKNLEAKKFLYYFIILVSFFTVELYHFYQGQYKYSSTFARIGIFIFLSCVLRNSIKQIDELVLKENEDKIMKKLAYTDILTGANNRAAFERDLNNLLDKENPPKIRVIMMDINNLKYVNDTFGHQEGDHMIKLSYDTMVEVFDSKANHYRLGGDEFTSILENVDEDDFKLKVDRFTKRLDELSNQLSYELKIAVGSDVYPNEDFKDTTMFLNHVDSLMYENKRQIKANALF